MIDRAQMLRNARRRARRKQMRCTLTHADVLNIIGDGKCYYCGCPVATVRGRGPGPRDSSPTLDRIWPELGYVPGNVVLACGRCNRLMDDASPDELERVATQMRRVRNERAPTHHEGET